jgi:hypothetical protein
VPTGINTSNIPHEQRAISVGGPGKNGDVALVDAFHAVQI